METVRERKPETKNNAPRILLGLALMLPASLACLITLVIPTLSTFVSSLQEVGFMRGGSHFVGLENYAHLSGYGPLGRVIGFTALMAVVRLMTVAIIPLMLSLSANELGQRIRISVRLLFTIPLALYTPVVAALAWRMAFIPPYGVWSGTSPFAGPESGRITLLLIDGLYTLTLACGLGLLVYLPALRGRGEATPTRQQVTTPVVVTLVIALIATIALTLQDFAFSYTLTGGGPGSTTMTLAQLQFREIAQTYNLGLAAATASLTLFVLLSLGLITGLLVTLTHLRLEVTRSDKPAGLFYDRETPEAERIVAILVLAISLLLGVAGLAISVLPPAATVFRAATVGGPGGAPSDIPFLASLANTAILPLVAIFLLQIPITYLAALGIGGLRPLGKHSEWLLLLFSPWLFVTTGPLSVQLFMRLRTVGLYNTVIATSPPVLISVSILIILTLLFKGQEPKWRAAIAEGKSASQAFFSELVVPSLPLTTLLAFAALLIAIQRLQWPFMAASAPERLTTPVHLLRLSAMFLSNPRQLGPAALSFALPTFLVFFAIFGTFQATYLDRLALTQDGNDAAPIGEGIPPTFAVDKPSSSKDMVID